MDVKEEVRSKLNIEDVVGEYIELKRAGRNFKALSPFNNEKTPSFIVSPEKQIWHDFSSNRGGDVFSFVMEMEGIDFRAALEILARKAGVDLPAYQDGRGKELQQRRERLYGALEMAAKFYQFVLSKQKAPQAYLYKKRSFNKKTVEEFRLGYAPTEGSSLVQFLLKRGFSVKELREAGLFVQRASGPSDMFRGRIMVPLCDGQGRVVGFTARLLVDQKNAPKYINTPQTLLYDKSRQVFGLHLAKEAIRQHDQAVIVEGNLDVIASHQAGTRYVVATAGTAITADHVRQLARLTPNIKLAFDSDNAGITATERAIVLAQEMGIELSVVTFPEGVKDTDDLVREDPDKWGAIISESTYAVDWLIDKYRGESNITTGEGKRRFSSKSLAVIDRLQDPVEKEHYLKKVAEELDVSVQSLVQKLSGAKKLNAKTLKPNKAPTYQANTNVHEDNFLALTLYFPKIRDSLTRGIGSGDFHGQERQKLWGFMADHVRSDLTHNVPDPLQSIATYVKIIVLRAEEQHSQLTDGEALLIAQELATRIKKERQKERLHNLSRELASSEAQGHESETQRLKEEVQRIIKGDQYGAKEAG
ncbi:MAG TPA: DNA primase [Candidatus Saccharimonadales bacterium]|nr:DNA primase [Candidatus Saccharimonadales bacterium]